jgi:hypothetical protein
VVGAPESDSFAGGVYANPRDQCLYGIFAARERADGVAVGDRLTGAER